MAMPTPMRAPAAVIPALALALALGACSRHGPSGPADASAAPLATQVVAAARTPVERVVDGSVEAVNQATLSAQTGGRVVEIRYDVDDVVPAGAVVVRLQSTPQRAGLRSAQAAVQEAQARATQAADSFQRADELYRRHVVTKAQHDQATANRDAAAARLIAAQAALETARTDLGYTEVRAPYGGVITRRLVQVGETVAPGTALMTGLSLRELRVNTHVPQSVVMQVRRLRQAAVYLHGERIEATGITLFPEVAMPSSTFRARLDLPPGALDLAPGMYVKVGLVVGDTQRILVPASALVERSEVTAVYVLDPAGRPALRYVRPGHRLGERVEILAGLAAGERSALDPLAAGARIAASHRP